MRLDDAVLLVCGALAVAGAVVATLAMLETC